MKTAIGALPILLRGAIVTLYLSVVCLAFSTAIGLVVGILAGTGNRVLKAVTGVYVYVIRGVPLLVQLFFVYFTLPFLGIYLPGELAASFGISLYGGAFISEIVRGAILSVPRGQADAGKALGYTTRTVTWKVVLPQALRYVLPPYVSNCATIIKATALVSIVSVWELTLAGKEIAQRTLETLPIVVDVLLIYFFLCYPLAHAGKRLEKRFTYIS